MRTNPQFVSANVVALDAPITLMGNYHLNVVRPVPERVVDLGSNANLAAPAVNPNPLTHDIDGDIRLHLQTSAHIAAGR